MDRSYNAATRLAICFLLATGCSESPQDRPASSPIDTAPINSSRGDSSRGDSSQVDTSVVDPAPISMAPLRHTPPAEPAILSARRGSHEEMLADLRQLHDHMATENKYLGDPQSPALRSALADVPSPSVQQWQLLRALGQSELRLGNEREALKYFVQAFDVAKQIGGKMPAGSFSKTLFDAGVGYLRLGETENCCVQNLPESCLFPIRLSAVHQKPFGSRRAINAFELLLKMAKPESSRYKQTYLVT